ncbi:MAG: methyl-accepting chemotaxis protein [Pseudomonadota bacterium]
MFHSSIATQKDRAMHRLKAFDLVEGGDEDYEIAFAILYERARDVAIAYTDHYMRTVKAFADPEKREAFLERVTEGFRARYTVPVGLDWIAKGEQIAHEIHRRGADPSDHLSALSVAQVQEIMLVFEGVENTAEGIRIAAKMSRLQALDAEILLTTVKELQNQKHFDWVQQEVGSFYEFLESMDEITAEKSQASESEAEEAHRKTGELSDLSGAVSKASVATATAMIEAAAAARDLRATLDQMVLDLSQTSQAMEEAMRVGRKAVTSVDALSAKSESIQTIAALIEEITDRSDVLALNASIEAARAGQAGFGFGVVASEMKAIAGQTGDATREIFAHVDAIKDAREDALDANGTMLETFTSVNDVMDKVREDVIAKSAAVMQISQQVDQTAEHAAKSRQSISAIDTLASGLSQQVAKTGTSLHELNGQIRAIRKGTDQFLKDLSVRASPNVREVSDLK